MPFVINADGDQVWEDWGQRAIVSTTPIVAGGVSYTQQGNGQWISTGGQVVDNAALSAAVIGGTAPVPATVVGVNLPANTATPAQLASAAAVTPELMAANQQASIHAAGLAQQAQIAAEKAASAAAQARLTIATVPNAGTYTQNADGTFFQMSGPLAGRNVSAAQFDSAHSTPPVPVGGPPPASGRVAPNAAPVTVAVKTPPLNVFDLAQVAKPARAPIVTGVIPNQPPAPTVANLQALIDYLLGLKFLK